MSKSNIKIILALVAVAMVVLTYMYVYKSNMDDKSALESEYNSLNSRYKELSAIDANRDQYIKDTEKFYDDFNTELEKYPADLNQETSIMFMKYMEEAQEEMSLNSVGLGTSETFYTLAGTIDVPDGYTCYQAAFPVTYEGGYDSVKTMIDYVMNYQYRMNVASINISYDDSTELYSGTITLNAYSVAGGDRKPDEIDVDVPNGVENLFLGGADAPSTTTYSYDSDNGASIATANDIKLTLNSADNDTAAGIVVSAGGTDTNVTSSDNKVVTVALHVYEEDGKNYAAYSIGDAEYTTELSGTDVRIYVDSSERVSDSDSNGVKLNITNDTDMTVFVKVDGDDSDSPRFTVGSKTGTVKVY